MDKRKVIEQIKAYLVEELESADEEHARELKRLLTVYRFLPQREYGKDDVVVPSAMVELKLGGARAYYFMAPQGGGLVTSVEGEPVQVITPQSPLGEALLGKKVGDTVEVAVRGTVRKYLITSIS